MFLYFFLLLVFSVLLSLSFKKIIFYYFFKKDILHYEMNFTLINYKIYHFSISKIKLFIFL